MKKFGIIIFAAVMVIVFLLSITIAFFVGFHYKVHECIEMLEFSKLTDDYREHDFQMNLLMENDIAVKDSELLQSLQILEKIIDQKIKKRESSAYLTEGIKKAFEDLPSLWNNKEKISGGIEFDQQLWNKVKIGMPFDAVKDLLSPSGLKLYSSERSKKNLRIGFGDSFRTIDFNDEMVVQKISEFGFSTVGESGDNLPGKVVIRVPLQRVVTDVNKVISESGIRESQVLKFNFSWFFSHGAQPMDYEVEYWHDENSKERLVTTNENQAIIMNVPYFGHTYFWRVRAKNKFGVGAWSETAVIESIGD